MGGRRTAYGSRGEVHASPAIWKMDGETRRNRATRGDSTSFEGRCGYLTWRWAGYNAVKWFARIECDKFWTYFPDNVNGLGRARRSRDSCHEIFWPDWIVDGKIKFLSRAEFLERDKNRRDENLRRDQDFPDGISLMRHQREKILKKENSSIDVCMLFTYLEFLRECNCDPIFNNEIKSFDNDRKYGLEKKSGSAKHLLVANTWKQICTPLQALETYHSRNAINRGSISRMLRRKEKQISRVDGLHL